MNKPELQERYQLYIDGQWRDASDKGFLHNQMPCQRRTIG